MLRRINSEIAEIYNERFLKLGPTPEASMWFSKTRQIARFDVIFNQLKLFHQRNSISISDVGCGYGAFLQYLSEKKIDEELSYYGYDVSPEVIKFCKNKYFERASFYTKSVPIHKTDFVIMSGTFNFFPIQDYNAWKVYLFNSLKLLWSKAKCAMIFNLQISNQAAITTEGIVYAAQEQVEQFCKKNFGNIRVINNPMIPKDKTFVVSK
jgi:SAM-dependent methyltransferase